MSLDYNDWAIGYSAEEINDILNYIYEPSTFAVWPLYVKSLVLQVAMADFI